MTLSIPLHKFSRKRSQGLQFQIAQMETLPDVARASYAHRHTFYEIFWVTSGVGTHIIDFEDYPVEANALYFITPGQVQAWTIERSVTGYALLFTDDFLISNQLEHSFLRSFDFFHRIDHSPMLRTTAEQVQPFHTICAHMHDEYMRDQLGRVTILQSLLQIFLIHAQRCYSAPTATLETTAGSALAQQFVRLIDLHFHDKQTVQAYADLLSITAGHLTDTTREVYGVSASQLIRQRLIVEAKRLLVHSEQTISEISAALRFVDPSYFARFFKRETKTTPRAFREKFRGKYP